MKSVLKTVRSALKDGKQATADMRNDERGVAVLSYGVGMSFVILPLALSSFVFGDTATDRAYDGLVAWLSNANTGLF